jgi:hypothetical protein
MQISSLGVQLSSTPNAPVYTWSQTWRFFLIGLVKAVIYGLIPVAVVLYHNYQNYSDPIDWSLVWEMIGAAVGPVAYSYWSEHKALLKAPPWLDIPPEFQPAVKKVEHTVQITTPATQDTPKIVETTKESHSEIVGIPPEKPNG